MDTTSKIVRHGIPNQHHELPSGYDEHSHGIDGPFYRWLKMVIFHGYVSHNQMVHD